MLEFAKCTYTEHKLSIRRLLIFPVRQIHANEFIAVGLLDHVIDVELLQVRHLDNADISIV